METLLTALIPIAISVLSAIGGYVVTYFKVKAMREELTSVIDHIKNGDHNYYVNCPSCGHKILLASVDIKEDVKTNENK